MQQLVYFIQRYKYFLFFLLLEFIALALIINNHSFHRSKFVSSANAITGGIFNKTSSFSDYLHLETHNKELLEENNQLKNLVEQYRLLLDTTTVQTVKDSLQFKQEYSFVGGRIRNNEFHKPHNFLTINRGKKNGITAEMAVINSKGIIGITDAVSTNYARVQSILNRNSKINAKFKRNDFFGSLTWNGENYNTVQLTDIPRQANFKVGDTIITGGRSAIFPEGIPVGTVSSLPENPSASNTINVKLFNDMSNIGPIYVIINLNKEELNQLENNINE